MNLVQNALILICYLNNEYQNKIFYEYHEKF